MLASLLKTDLIMLHPLMRYYYKYKYGAYGVVYMLHRVGELNPNGISYNENMKVSPKWLEQIILSYKQHGFQFLSLDDLYSILMGEKHSQHPFVVFTLDDGYVDNYTLAYPIFKKHDVPFCVYVATSFPNKTSFLWWYALEDYLKDKENKEDLFIKLRSKILKFPKNTLLSDFKQLIPDFHVNLDKYVKSEALSWEQIEDMAKNPLCTIGGHTVTHPALSTLSENEIRVEITEGIKEIESHINKKVYHFAYPYGSTNEANEREYRVTEQFGFKTIATTIGGTISKTTNPLRLPRYMLMDLNYIKHDTYC